MLTGKHTDLTNSNNTGYFINMRQDIVLINDPVTVAYNTYFNPFAFRLAHGRMSDGNSTSATTKLSPGCH